MGSTKGGVMQDMGLKSLISALREEIFAAEKEARNSDLKLSLQDIKVDLEFAVEQQVDAQAGIKAWVFDFGVSSNNKDILTQKIQLSLKPYAVDQNTGAMTNIEIMNITENDGRG